jgi:glycosyltransferase involved in cell wall biosynthesis
MFPRRDIKESGRPGGAKGPEGRERGSGSVEGRGSPKVSVVIPIYNERENILALGEEVRRSLMTLGARSEVIFVDDGSDDGSTEVLARIRLSSPEVRVLRLAKNAGQSSALAAGIRAARGEIVVTMDGDGQNDPADIIQLVSLTTDYDAVIGYRLRRADTWIRRVSGIVANAVRSAILGDKVIDTGCGLKAFRRACFETLPAFDGMHRFLPALLQMRGYRVHQVPVRHRLRTAGRSKYGMAGRLRRTVPDLFGVLWLKRRRIVLRADEAGPPRTDAAPDQASLGERDDRQPESVDPILSKRS